MPNKEGFTQVHIIDASAGSGKTYALAREYLGYLMNPAFASENIPQKNILAITFTNKATSEMKQRILEFLKKIALDAFSSEEEKKDILSALGGIGLEAARRRARAVIDLIIRSYDFFRVQTIDSFINSVISGCSFSLDISAGFRIETDYQPYLDYCLDGMIELSAKDAHVKKTITEFLDHYLNIEQIKGWFPKRKMAEIIKKLFEFSNTYGLPFRKNPAVTNKDILGMKKEVFLLVESLSGCLPESTNGTFKKSVNNFLEKKSERFALSSLPPGFDKDKPVPVNKGGECPEKVLKKWELIQEKLKKICEIEVFFRYATYLDVYDLVMKDFREYTGKEDVIFLNELNKKAKYLFDSESLTVPELYYRFATRFRHYLVDEFQDTSRLQWMNLSPMVDEALASGGTLFYVGDKKQAIYGFRGGEYNLFDEAKGYYSQYKVKEDLLCRNYRSQKEIVNFNNEVFSRDNLQKFLQDYTGEDGMLNKSHVEEITAIFAESRQEHKAENMRGYVKLEKVQAEDKEQKNEIISGKLIKLVRGLKARGYGYEDICVLLRDNKDVELVTGWLLAQKDIPVESEKTLNIRENFLIKELFSFLSFLRFQPDNISFVSFILGDIFIKATKLDRQKLQDFLFATGSAKGRDEKVLLYVKFREAFPEIWEEYIREFTSRVGLVPLYDFMISILGRFNVLKNFPNYQGFIMAFLELIKTRQDEESGIESFIDYFNDADDKDMFVNVAASDSVKVMTIHKAKGLEFGVVILPFLDFNPGELKKKISQDFVIFRSKEELSLASLSQNYVRFSELIEKMYAEELKKSFIEELNTAYVAFTRAKNELYILMPYKKEENIACLLIPESVTERGKQDLYKEQKDKQTPSLEIPPCDYSDWMKLIEYEFAGRVKVGDRKLAAKGEVIHYMLCNIDSGENIAEKVRRKYLYFTDIDSCFEAAKNITGNEECKKIFALTAGATAFNEKEVVDASGNTKRIDRLIVSEKEAWVIDYKISENESPDHKKQIEEYMRMVGEIFPGKVVKGFLLYANGKSIKLREIV